MCKGPRPGASNSQNGTAVQVGFALAALAAGGLKKNGRVFSLAGYLTPFVRAVLRIVSCLFAYMGCHLYICIYTYIQRDR